MLNPKLSLTSLTCTANEHLTFEDKLNFFYKVSIRFEIQIMAGIICEQNVCLLEDLICLL